MSHKKLITNQPVRYKIDKKGNKIPIYRGATLDKNKYAKLTPQEQHNRTQIGKDTYEAPPTVDSGVNMVVTDSEWPLEEEEGE